MAHGLFPPIKLLVLAALMGRPLHTYAIRQKVIELSRHRLYEAPKTSVKRAIEELVKAGYLQDCTDALHWAGHRRGDVYELSKAGSLPARTKSYCCIWT